MSLTGQRFASMRWRAREQRESEGDDDRALHLDDAERAESVDHARGGRPPLPRPPNRHPQRRSSSIPTFLKIAPNNKIPAIVDTDNGLHLMESGAILLYLAEKTGKLWPQDFPTKWRVVEWLMWQMGGVGAISRPGASFREVQSRQERLCRGALRQGGEAAVGRARPAAWPRSNMSQATTRSPISPSGRGSRASPGRGSNLPSIPT